MARGTATHDARLTRGGRPGGAGGRRSRVSTAVPSLAALSACAAMLAVTTVLAGCGSASVDELPPAAGPDRAPPITATPAGQVTAPGDETHSLHPPLAPTTRSTFRDGSLEAVLIPRERVLTIVDVASRHERARVSAGVGPTNVVCAPKGPCFVTDTQGDGLLVMRVGPGGRELRLIRRVYLAGAPYAIALDPERRRLWVTLTGRNELAELGAHGRPHLLDRLPTIRQPNDVGVDPATGDVSIRSPSGERQRIADPASADR